MATVNVKREFNIVFGATIAFSLAFLFAGALFVETVMESLVEDDSAPTSSIELLSIIKNNKTLSDQQCYFLRCLLIHEYRRVLLKDHELPENMLPENWSGFYANELVKNLYAYFSKGSNRYISQLENADGYLPKASSEFNKSACFSRPPTTGGGNIGQM